MYFKKNTGRVVAPEMFGLTCRVGAVAMLTIPDFILCLYWSKSTDRSIAHSFHLWLASLKQLFYQIVQKSYNIHWVYRGLIIYVCHNLMQFSGVGFHGPCSYAGINGRLWTLSTCPDLHTKRAWSQVFIRIRQELIHLQIVLVTAATITALEHSRNYFLQVQLHLSRTV